MRGNVIVSQQNDNFDIAKKETWKNINDDIANIVRIVLDKQIILIPIIACGLYMTRKMDHFSLGKR